MKNILNELRPKHCSLRFSEKEIPENKVVALNLFSMYDNYYGNTTSQTYLLYILKHGRFRRVGEAVFSQTDVEAYTLLSLKGDLCKVTLHPTELFQEFVCNLFEEITDGITEDID